MPYLALKEILRTMDICDVTSLSFCSKRTRVIVKQVRVSLKGWKIWAVIYNHLFIVIRKTGSVEHPVLRVASYNSIPVGSTLQLQTIKMDGRSVDAGWTWMFEGYGCLTSFWLNEEVGFKKAINYVADLFNIDCFSVHLRERGIWMIDWINTLPRNRVSTLKFQTFDRKPTSKDDLAYVIQNAKAKELWINGDLDHIWNCPSNFENFDVVRIKLAENWFDVHNLMNMRCSEISTNTTNLTCQDINTFLKHWIQGGSSQLAWLSVVFSYRDVPTENNILAGIEGFCRKVENKRYILKENLVAVPSLVCFDGLEIHRSDGLTASISLVTNEDRNKFHMAVWQNIVEAY